MKSRKRALQPPEECGVWLDASQLKKKCHQMVIPCTSSRFNPLSRTKSMDSVQVDFTQTKSPQLFTKQTSMYSFFSAAGSRNKRSPITDINTLIQETPKCETGNAYESLNVMEQSPVETSMCSKPAEIQESVSLCNLHRNTREPVSSGQNENNDRSWVLEQSGNHSGSFSNVSVVRTQDKSPNHGFSSEFQNKLSDSSIVKCPQKDYHEEDSCLLSQFDSPLFTQDTQGNRVICHQSTSDRHLTTPLQDKTNVTWHTRSQIKGTLQTLCDEDSLHIMFTQDSEGNMVIKH
ncbi:aurora kinase A and ninein-interacting protein [Bufo bufo]|uniref:aurora kinase A and ninein-interacting protein n=1 Tax=Bufo bufo TaxID=8384 RepID=UPI001ABE0F60|nr:aurora kinase A and ninein-interacting protein [Bufo bufo]